MRPVASWLVACIGIFFVACNSSGNDPSGTPTRFPESPSPMVSTPTQGESPAASVDSKLLAPGRASFVACVEVVGEAADPAAMTSLIQSELDNRKTFRNWPSEFGVPVAESGCPWIPEELGLQPLTAVPAEMRQDRASEFRVFFIIADKATLERSFPGDVDGRTSDAELLRSQAGCTVVSTACYFTPEELIAGRFEQCMAGVAGPAAL